MTRARTLVSIVLLLSYGAVGARQPAVRTSVPLPAPAARLAEALGLPTIDRSRVVIDVVRLVFDSPDGNDASDGRLRARLNALMQAGTPGETAPLPLDPSIWRDTLLMRDVPDQGLLAAILSDRKTALLYHGLAALDDETLAWLGPDRALLADLSEHAGAFAAFARSLQVKGGRVQVPGGPPSEAAWAEVVGVSPAQPADFARRLFTRSEGRLAFFYDTIAHLDESSRKFAMAGPKAERFRALEQVFERSSVELKPRERPFSRQFLDPSLSLMAIDVSADGTPYGPLARGLWEAVFKGDDKPDYEFKEAAAAPKNTDASPLDAAWITSRIHRNSTAAARRRLDTFLFAQRVFRKPEPGDPASVTTALRGMLSFPTLMLALERSGVRNPAVYATAAVRAHALDGIGDTESRRIAIMQFQSALAIVERMVQTGGLSADRAASLVALLTAIDVGASEGSERLASWIVDRLVPAVGSPATPSSLEAAVLHGMSGARPGGQPQTIEWEGRHYRVNAADGEFARLRSVRRRQGGPSLDQALAPFAMSVEVRSGADRTRHRDAGKLAQVLTSLVYAAYLGDPDGTALAAENVALRHDLGIDSGAKPNPLSAWRLATESFGGSGGWMLRGSLLGIEAPLAKFALRRLDSTVMPPAPRLTSNERQTAALTVALMRPQAMDDDARDRIVAALERGRARVAALKSDPSQLADVARDAGVSEWRRQQLAWTMTNDPGRVDEQFSFLEFLWLGTPAGSSFAPLDPWGAAGLAVKGCLCLAMPRPGQWESLSGRPASGILATRGADVGLLVAEALARLRLPASLAPGVMTFAMQDVLDATQPAYFDDWSQFGRAAKTISSDRMADYIAALTAGGPLLPLTENGKQP